MKLLSFRLCICHRILYLLQLQPCRPLAFRISICWGYLNKCHSMLPKAAPTGWIGLIGSFTIVKMLPQQLNRVENWLATPLKTKLTAFLLLGHKGRPGLLLIPMFPGSAWRLHVGLWFTCPLIVSVVKLQHPHWSKEWEAVHSLWSNLRLSSPCGW